MNDSLLLKITDYKFGLPVFVDEGVVPSDVIGSMGLWSFIFALLSLFIFFGCAFLLDKKYRWLDEKVNKNLSLVFGVTWILCFMVYDIGMYTGEPWSLLGNVPMAIVHAFEAFIFESDVSAIHGHFHNNAWFMFFFSLVHFLAALVSLIFVLKHFGFNIIAYFRRRLDRSSQEETFVFWGMNEATYHLAKDIKYNSGLENPRIVIIRTNDDADLETPKNAVERLFSFLSFKDKDLYRLKEIGCLTLNNYVKLSERETIYKNDEEREQRIEKSILTKDLCRIIDKTTSKLHVFFLSNNDESNILNIAKLKSDCKINEFATGKKEVKLYCHARYNSVHRVIEDQISNPNIEVRVVDSSHISVELLKSQVKYHPVNYVSIEKDATVSSSFNSLVVGFGEVGLDVVRFLYEYGAFVKSGEQKVLRSEFCCHVVDRDMGNLAGQFTVNAPSIITTADSNKDYKQINLHTMDCRSVDFYEKLKEWIKSLNYVVVSTGDVELNMSLAVRIFRLAIRERRDGLERFRIMVRVSRDSTEHFREIAKYYNRLWAAEKVKNDTIHQKTILATDNIETPIELFGSVEEIYTYKNIVAESLKEEAAEYKKKYDKLDKDSSAIEEWNKEQKEMMQLKGEYKGFSPTFSGVMKLRRIQTQNIANSQHKETKVLLAKKALGREFHDEVSQHGLVRNEGSLIYNWCDKCVDDEKLSKVQNVLDTIAQTEHLRWNASHEILGYQGCDAEDFKDEARLIHGGLRNWSELSDKFKEFDYNVVDVSIDLIKS